MAKRDGAGVDHGVLAAAGRGFRVVAAAGIGDTASMRLGRQRGLGDKAPGQSWRCLMFALVACAPVSLGCGGKQQAATASPDAGSTDGDQSAGSSSAGPETIAVGPAAIVGRELPGELVAELRLRGDDQDGRLLTLAPGFVATAACSDCGAPSYLRFLAVRCSDTTHCEVLTEACEGTIGRDADSYALEFRAVEGVTADAGDAACTDYSGVFELP